MLRLEEISIVKSERSLLGETNYAGDDRIAQRRATLTALYDALPEYGSVAFWHAIEKTDMGLVLPLEVLVRCLRTAVAREDEQGRNRVIEVIFRRIQTNNEYWANTVLKHISLLTDERKALVRDLFADLCESLIRALIDPQRLFWEENFQHCLRYERMHAYQSCMQREARWHRQQVQRSLRIPRKLVASLSRPIQHGDGELEMLEIEDEQAQNALLAVEHDELPRLVLFLPEKLKAVVLLLFWEGKSTADAAHVLGVTDRTVRNRLRNALKLLRTKLEPEKGGVYG